MAKKQPSSRRSDDSTLIGYGQILTDLKQAIRDSRHRALATVNRERVCLCWHIGRVIVEQQETAKWGDAVVEQLAADLRIEFPDMKGLSRDNVFRMRQFFVACRDTGCWFQKNLAATEKAVVENEQIATGKSNKPKVGTAPRLFGSSSLADLIPQISWSHHYVIMGACVRPDERYFYMTMSVRERWSVRELRRQIDAALFERYVSVKRDPEKCLPSVAEQGDLLPFNDHYILEFVGLEDAHSEKQLRKAILAILRDFFLEFGKDLTFVGEEYPLTIGNDTFYIDLLFFHRRLQCLLPIDLKIDKFKPEYVGKSRFYCTALDEQVRLPHANPSIGLVLCKTADKSLVRLALTDAATKIGIATYQTALPDQRLIQRRLEQLTFPKETS